MKPSEKIKALETNLAATENARREANAQLVEASSKLNNADSRIAALTHEVRLLKMEKGVLINKSEALANQLEQSRKDALRLAQIIIEQSAKALGL